MSVEHGVVYGNDRTVEVIAQGRERKAWSPRRPSLRRRPRTVAASVAVAALVASGFGAYVLTGPRVPRLSVVSGPAAHGSPAVVAWQPGVDERPTGGVFLSMTALLALDGTASGGSQVEVLGIAGPGIVGDASSPVRLHDDGTPTTAVLAADVDCTKVRLPMSADGYGLRVRVVDGSRQVVGLAAAGAVGRRWAGSITAACGSWLARQDLTVTEVSATVDALEARVQLSFTIANSGRSTGYVTTAAASTALAVSASPPGIIAVPPATGAHVTLRLDVQECDAIPPLPPSDSGGVYGTTGDVLGLYALVGAPPVEPTGQPASDGLGPTGVVFGRGAASAVAMALRSACGGLGPYVTRLAPGGVAFDRRTGVLTVRVVLDGTPGRVADLRLVTDPAPADDTGVFGPLWGTSATLRPDPAGQVTATLRYQAPVRGPTCPTLGSWLPAFTVVAHVPVPGGVKTLRYSQFINPLEWPEAVRELCRPAA